MTFVPEHGGGGDGGIKRAKNALSVFLKNIRNGKEGRMLETKKWGGKCELR